MKKSARRTMLIGIFLTSILSILIVRPNIPLPAIMQDTITLTLGIIYEAMPFIILGVLLSVLVQLFVPSSFLLKILPKHSFYRRFILSISGTLLPVCECGNVPLARGLIAKGLRPQEVLTFLFAAPIINPITIYTTTQAFQFDQDIVLLRVASALIIAMSVGYLFQGAKTKKLLKEDFITYCKHHDHDELRPSIIGKVKQFAARYEEEFMQLLPALLGGSLVAGLIQTTVPRSILTAVSDQPILAILTMILLAFIISICANVDAFFALSLSSIFPKSAIVAFLVFGPMIDIKMLALLKTTFTPHVLIVSSLFITFSTILVGLGVHYVF